MAITVLELEAQYQPDSYNIGVNVGEAAGALGTAGEGGLLGVESVG